MDPQCSPLNVYFPTNFWNFQRSAHKTKQILSCWQNEKQFLITSRKLKFQLKLVYEFLRFLQFKSVKEMVVEPKGCASFPWPTFRSRMHFEAGVGKIGSRAEIVLQKCIFLVSLGFCVLQRFSLERWRPAFSPLNIKASQSTKNELHSKGRNHAAFQLVSRMPMVGYQ